MSTYRVTLTHIRCIMPSASTNVDAPENARLAKEILDAAGEAVEVIPEIGEIAGPIFQVAGALTEGVADLVSAIDKARRDAGLDPDNLYITRYLLAPVPRQGVIWPRPDLGDPATPGGTCDIAKGQQIDGGGAPLFIQDFTPSLGPIGLGTQGFAFWDKDGGPGDGHDDDLLLQIPLFPILDCDPQYLGQNLRTLYTPAQDCTYEIGFTVEQVA